jgi:hypothetical protein
MDSEPTNIYYSPFTWTLLCTLFPLFCVSLLPVIAFASLPLSSASTCHGLHETTGLLRAIATVISWRRGSQIFYFHKHDVPVTSIEYDRIPLQIEYLVPATHTSFRSTELSWITKQTYTPFQRVLLALDYPFRSEHELVKIYDQLQRNWVYNQFLMSKRKQPKNEQTAYKHLQRN